MFSTGICGLFKVGLLHSKKTIFIDFNESSLKIMKNASYFMLKALFVLDIFTFLYWLFGYVEKRLDKEAMTSQTGQQLIAIHILRNIPRNEGNQTMKFGQLIEYNMRNIFLEKSYTKCRGVSISLD